MSNYEAYQNGRKEMKQTIDYAIEPLVRADRRSLSEMQTYAESLTREQLVSLAIAMQHLVNNVLYEIKEAK